MSAERAEDLERMAELIARLQLSPTTSEDVENLADYAARLYQALADAQLEVAKQADRYCAQLAQKDEEWNGLLARCEAAERAEACQVCWFIAWEPTEEGVRCGHCWLMERAAALEGAIENFIHDNEAALDRLWGAGRLRDALTRPAPRTEGQ